MINVIKKSILNHILHSSLKKDIKAFYSQLFTTRIFCGIYCFDMEPA